MCQKLSLPLCGVCAGLRKPVHTMARLGSKVQLIFLSYLFLQVFDPSVKYVFMTSFFFFFNIYLASLGGSIVVFIAAWGSLVDL